MIDEYTESLVETKRSILLGIVAAIRVTVMDTEGQTSSRSLCHHFSVAAKKYFGDGAKIVTGWFDGLFWHDWVEYDGWILDGTADQFNDPDLQKELEPIGDISYIDTVIPAVVVLHREVDRDHPLLHLWTTVCRDQK